MQEMLIRYNPYRLETMILVDNEVPPKRSKLHFEDRRLQEWIEELPEIVFDEYRTRKFKITFYGTVLDFEDVEFMKDKALKHGFDIELEHIPAQEVTDKENCITEIFNEIQRGPFDELKQPDVINAFNAAKTSVFEVNVIATMSAGKSTLINALLRQKLMPAKQEACTATITEIKDNDGSFFSAEAYDDKGEFIVSYGNLSLANMEELNSNPRVSKICIEGDIPFVSSEDISLVLVDTPGPNNSRNLAHKAATYRMISESSKTLVLYIINATQLATDDDYRLLSHVADSMRVGGKQSRDRFIFVVNKLDEFRKGEDDIDSAIGKVRDYLKDNGIENPNIYPASALTALDIRTILSENNADDDDTEFYEAMLKVRKFNRTPEMHFETKAPLSPSVRKQLELQLDEARISKDENSEALIHCGIIPIELGIQTYVQKYAKTAKIRNIVDTFSKRLESAKSFEKTRQEIAEKQDKQREILSNITTIERKLASGEEAKKFEGRIAEINFDEEINDLTNRIVIAAQKKVTDRLTSIDEHLGIKEAKKECERFIEFSENLQAEIQVKLEELVANHIVKNANALLDEYKAKIAELAQDVDIGILSLDPFEIIGGFIDGIPDVNMMIKEATKTERKKAVVGRHKEYKEIFGLRRWLNETFGTNFNVDYEWVLEYGMVDHDYIDGAILAQRFLAPIQERLYEYSNATIAYAKDQTENIKKEFTEKFEELNVVLAKKLEELKAFTEDNKNIEMKIKESKDKLEWLEKIQEKTMAILEI